MLALAAHILKTEKAVNFVQEKMPEKDFRRFSKTQ